MTPRLLLLCLFALAYCTCVRAQCSDLSVRIEMTSDYGGYDVSCPFVTDGEAIARVSPPGGGYTYAWSSGGTERTLGGMSSNLRYWVRVTRTSDGCTATDTLQPVAPPPVQAEIELPSTACPVPNPMGRVANISGGTPPYRVTLRTSTGQFIREVGTSSFPITDRATTAFIDDAYNCGIDFRIEYLPDTPELDLGIERNVVLSPGDTLYFDPATNLENATYTIRPGDGTAYTAPFAFVPPQSGEYRIKASDGECSAERIFGVALRSFNSVFIPSAFSPNGDETNDVFKAYLTPFVDEVSGFTVYDRWGGVVYSWAGTRVPGGREPVWGWDGTDGNGRALAEGTYLYRLGVRYADGRGEVLAGAVLLVR